MYGGGPSPGAPGSGGLTSIPLGGRASSSVW